MQWVMPFGKFDRERWRSSWQALPFHWKRRAPSREWTTVQTGRDLTWANFSFVRKKAASRSRYDRMATAIEESNAAAVRVKRATVLCANELAKVSMKRW